MVFVVVAVWGFLLGSGVMAARCTLDAEIGVQIPAPQPKMKYNLYSKLLVVVQLLLIFLIASYCGIIGNVYTTALFLASIALGVWAMASMKFKVSAFPEVSEKNNKLVIVGPYKYIRHPMYTSVLLATFSWVLIRLDFISLFLWFLLLVDLILKSRYEEKLLIEKFSGYPNYKSKTKRFIPFLI